jgi:spore coat protein U-like protein
MLKFKSKSLVRALVAAGLVSIASMAIAAGTASSTVTVDATLVSACEVSTTAAIHFGNITNLLSAGDNVADSGSSFQVACSSDVAPLVSAAASRIMVNGTNNLPFNLSLTSGAIADDFPPTATGLAMTKDGTLQTVTLYAKVLAANFTGANNLPGGSYSKTMTVAVAY